MVQDHLYLSNKRKPSINNGTLNPNNTTIAIDY